MADFTEFLNNIAFLDENISVTFQNTAGIDNLQTDYNSNDSYLLTTTRNFDTNMPSVFDTSAISQFNPDIVGESTDLSDFLAALKKTTTSFKKRVHRKPPICSGIPIQFFKDTNMPTIKQLTYLEGGETINISPGSDDDLQKAIHGPAENIVVCLKAGIYKTQLEISKNITILCEGEVIFDTDSPSIRIKKGNVIINSICIRHGNIQLEKGNLLIGNSEIFTSIKAEKDTELTCRGCNFSSIENSCVKLTSSKASIADSIMSDHGIECHDNSYLTIVRSKLEGITGSGLVVSDSTVRIEDASIGDCTTSCIYAYGTSDVSLSSVNIYDSSEGCLIEARQNGIVKAKGGSLTGSCTEAVFASSGAAIMCEDIIFKRSVRSEDEGLLLLKRCKLFSAVAASSRLVLNGCSVEGAPQSGILAAGFSDVQMEECTIEKCGSNGAELSGQTTATVERCYFRSNTGAGVTVASTSAVFRQCTFESNGVTGAEVAGPGAHPVFEGCNFVENGQASATAFEDTEPVFEGCKFFGNESAAAALVGSSGEFRGCSFSTNAGVGIDLSGCSTTVEGCSFEGNDNVSAQIHGASSSCCFRSCTFSTNQNSPAAVVFDRALSRFESCSFSRNGPFHVEVKDEGSARLEKCVLTESVGGIGVLISHGGRLELVESTVKQEKVAGVYVGALGRAEIEMSEITECGRAGIVTDSQSSTTVRHSTIKGNGNAGIQAESGEVVAEENSIEGHSMFGIYATSLARVTEEGNKFAKNEKADMQIASGS